MRQVRSANVAAALDRAVAGDPRDLFRALEIQSGLPGPRVNLELAVAFAHDCAKYGPKVDALAYAMAGLPADEARGASGKEFLVMCGVLAVGARVMVAREKAVAGKALELLERMADDVRFRVRDAVPLALAMMGSKMKDELGELVEPWMDRYFHAAAVIRALAEPAWLETYAKDDYYQPINLLHAAFVLAHEAPRSAFRYPGHKALVEALQTVPNAMAKRFPQQMCDRYGIWAEWVDVPELREVVLKNLDDAYMKKAFAFEVKRMKETMEARRPKRRDEGRAISGTRGRGRKRGS
jgi:hypothetical protein